MKRHIFMGLIVVLIAGCASTYSHTDLHKIQSKLDANAGVLISVPKDGFYETKIYLNSGRSTANAFNAAFSKKVSKVDVIDSCHGNDCLNNIDTQKYQYYVEPNILHWEDRNTEWSGKPDRIEIQIIIFDTRTKQELANSSFTGKSKWGTMGGDHPQDLLQEPTEKYVNSLYR
jgi:hypothetical protein